MSRSGGASPRRSSEPVDGGAGSLEVKPTEAAFIPSLASVLEHIVASADSTSTRITTFHAVSEPSISISDYISRVARCFGCSNECFVLALIYLDRILRRHPSFRICLLNVHRLILSAVMVAAKYFDDTYFSNRHYARVGGVRTVELNLLEAQFLSLISFDLYVTAEEYARYRQDVLAAVQQQHRKLLRPLEAKVTSQLSALPYPTRPAAAAFSSAPCAEGGEDAAARTRPTAAEAATGSAAETVEDRNKALQQPLVEASQTSVGKPQVGGKDAIRCSERPQGGGDCDDLEDVKRWSHRHPHQEAVDGGDGREGRGGSFIMDISTGASSGASQCVDAEETPRMKGVGRGLWMDHCPEPEVQPLLPVDSQNYSQAALDMIMQQQEQHCVRYSGHGAVGVSFFDGRGDGGGGGAGRTTHGGGAASAGNSAAAESPKLHIPSQEGGGAGRLQDSTGFDVGGQELANHHHVGGEGGGVVGAVIGERKDCQQQQEHVGVQTTGGERRGFSAVSELLQSPPQLQQQQRSHDCHAYVAATAGAAAEVRRELQQQQVLRSQLVSLVRCDGGSGALLPSSPRGVGGAQCSERFRRVATGGDLRGETSSPLKHEGAFCCSQPCRSSRGVNVEVMPCISATGEEERGGIALHHPALFRKTPESMVRCCYMLEGEGTAAATNPSDEVTLHNRRFQPRILRGGVGGFLHRTVRCCQSCSSLSASSSACLVSSPCIGENTGSTCCASEAPSPSSPACCSSPQPCSSRSFELQHRPQQLQRQQQSGACGQQKPGDEAERMGGTEANGLRLRSVQSQAAEVSPPGTLQCEQRHRRLLAAPQLQQQREQQLLLRGGGGDTSRRNPTDMSSWCPLQAAAARRKLPREQQRQQQQQEEEQQQEQEQQRQRHASGARGGGVSGYHGAANRE